MAHRSKSFADADSTRSLRATTTGPAQAGYLAQILLYGILLALFLDCYTSGELASTGPLGRTALTLSLSLNTAYTGLCAYEAIISSGASPVPLTRSAKATRHDGLCTRACQLMLNTKCRKVWQNRTWAFLSNGDLPWNALPLLSGLIAIVTEVALAYRAGKVRV